MIVGTIGTRTLNLDGTKWKWSLEEDVALCRTVLEHGREHVVPTLKWIQGVFTPVPLELLGRTHMGLFSRLLKLQPLLLKHLEASGYSGEELYKWLYTRHLNSKDRRRAYTFEEDLSLCREVVRTWRDYHAPFVPSPSWFDHHVVGRNPVLEKRSGFGLYLHYRNCLSHGLERAVVAHNQEWSFVQIDFSWLKEKHGLSLPGLENLDATYDDFSVDAEQPLGQSSEALCGANLKLPLWHHHETSAFDVVENTSSATATTTTIVSPTSVLPHSVSSSPDGVPERPLKRRRMYMQFTYEEDECICLAILRVELDLPCNDRWDGRKIGPLWFQKHLLDKGLLSNRSRKSLYDRYSFKLRRFLSYHVALEWTNVRLQGGTFSLYAVEQRVLNWLRERHFW